MSLPFPLDLKGPLPPLITDATLLADCYRSDKARLSGLKRRLQLGATRLGAGHLLPPANTPAFADLLLRFHQDPATRDLLLEDRTIPGLPKVRRAVGLANALYAYASDKLGADADPFQECMNDQNLIPASDAAKAVNSLPDETWIPRRRLCLLMVLGFAILEHEDARAFLDAALARDPETGPLLGIP